MDFVVCGYLIEGPDFPRHPYDYTEIKRSGAIVDGFVRIADLDRWKIERQRRVLCDDGRWVLEPQPPASRDAEFLRHHRFTLEQAKELAAAYALEPWEEALLR
jgi:hypothetical protein